jgi:hypothetical protein
VIAAGPQACLDLEAPSAPTRASAHGDQRAATFGGAFQSRGSLSVVREAFDIKMRRVGERRTWPFGRRRPEYEIVIVNGDGNIYETTTVAPSIVLVDRGSVHPTDARDWVQAADLAYNPHQESWVSGLL